MIYKKLKKYVPEKLGFAYGGIFMALVSSVFVILSYYHIYHFLDRVISETGVRDYLGDAMIIVMYLVLGVLASFVSVMFTHILAFRLETNLKKEGIRHIMNASFSFFDKNESGRVRKIIDDNTVMTHSSVAHLIPDLSSAVFIPLLGVALSFYIDYRLGILFIATIVMGLLMTAKMMGDRSFMSQYMQAAEKMNAGAVEYVRGIPVLKIFRANIEALKDFYQSVTSYSKLALQYSMSCRGWYVVFQVFFNVVFLLVMFFQYMGADDLRSFLVKFMFYAIFNGVIFVSFMKIMYVGMYTFQANSCIAKIEALFDEMAAEKLNSGSLDEINNSEIEFENVTFGYEDSTVINDLSFKLAAGRQYALVGASGSGKSTIAKLISGFYRLNSGKIKIGGHSLEEYSEKALARNIANVFQDAKLFKTSIYENVRIGNPSAGREQVMEALHLAQCDEIIEKFEEREETLIGAKGVHLSGGEVQRITIARALLKNAKIVIMDEASAAADPENEYELQRALANLMKGRTVIMIAHRLSTIKNVDEILVVDGGKIIERGSHGELMGRESVYKRLQSEYASANEWRVR